ncbi:MAG: glycosyltransferase family protein [Elusimicrobia bacterium]|nr:glycosyltransferase family protein [Elusimicrobiota bacterium]
MGSTRLPGKSLMLIAGKPALELLLERLGRARTVDQIVVATTVNAEDDAIVRLCGRLGMACFRGSPDDVLGRVSDAARWAKADVIVEITGDCPLTCPEVVDEAVRTFLAGGIDYLSNLLEQTYPQAVDVRVFRAADLREVHERLAGADQPLREHVPLYFEEHPERYRTLIMRAPPEYHRPDWRLDLDYEEDLMLLRRIFEALYPKKPDFSLRDLVAFLDAHPELKAINQGMLRKPLRPEADHR